MFYSVFLSFFIFFSLCFRLVNFCWPIFRFIDSFLIYVESKDKPVGGILHFITIFNFFLIVSISLLTLLIFIFRYGIKTLLHSRETHKIFDTFCFTLYTTVVPNYFMLLEKNLSLGCLGGSVS